MNNEISKREYEPDKHENKRDGEGYSYKQDIYTKAHAILKATPSICVDSIKNPALKKAVLEIQNFLKY